MANRWGKIETVTDFIFLGSKITVDAHCSLEIKILALGRRAMTNLDSILKSRDITKVCIVMVFPGVMYGCESWTIKKAVCWRIDSFELWCWRRLLRVPWTARRPNQSILKEISPEYSLEELMLKLKLQYFGHLMNWLIGKDHNDGKDWKQEKKGMTEDEMVGCHHQLSGHEFEQTPGDGEGQGNLASCSLWGCKESDTTEWLNNKQQIFGLLDLGKSFEANLKKSTRVVLWRRGCLPWWRLGLFVVQLNGLWRRSWNCNSYLPLHLFGQKFLEIKIMFKHILGL